MKSQQLNYLNTWAFEGLQQMKITNVSLADNVLGNYVPTYFINTYPMLWKKALNSAGTYALFNYVTDLDLSHNQYEAFNSSIFEGVNDTVTTLRLQGNQLTGIHKNTFRYLRKLTYLDLRYSTSLTFVGQGAFDGPQFRTGAVQLMMTNMTDVGSWGEANMFYITLPPLTSCADIWQGPSVGIHRRGPAPQM